MIFRRRHTANYTTIGNALFEDERLAADELGILAWLLSRPDDWEIRRPALMRRHKVGRDGLKRIITNWMRTGWCQAKKTRLSNGTFHIIYEIRDEPGRDLTEDEIRGALSLVSSEAADGGSDVEDAADQLRETGDPPTPQPGVADQRVASRSWPKKELLNPEHQGLNPPKEMRAFSDVLAGWHSDHILSPLACETSFAPLTESDKEACYAGIKSYLANCAAQGRKICDLRTYIAERRWERLAAVKSTGSATFKIRSAQWYRWREYKVAIGENVKFMDHYAENNPNGIWTSPSEWPPAMPKAESTGPPQSLATEEDLNEFAKHG